MAKVQWVKVLQKIVIENLIKSKLKIIGELDHEVGILFVGKSSMGRVRFNGMDFVIFGPKVPKRLNCK